MAEQQDTLPQLKQNLIEYCTTSIGAAKSLILELDPAHYEAAYANAQLALTVSEPTMLMRKAYSLLDPGSRMKTSIPCHKKCVSVRQCFPQNFWR
jgi:hypothetical protein